ncbi:MAG TPA: HAMP domain-containing sensor histidine kinase [Micromonosporaceae bacterium]|nr:HAMP domain-containing sensor histidine kinase [Micromonosporaceae bacterium]
MSGWTGDLADATRDLAGTVGRAADGAPGIRRARLLGAQIMDALPRPLDVLPWIKLKLGLALVGGGVASLFVFYVGIGWVPVSLSVTAIAVALVTSQILAHGMTRPLREMTAASRAMARGDYTRRVRATARDEVGQLADAFNQMATDLAEADQQRRELIATVSHELRTPIFALQAVLENVVDGVEVPDAATLQTALAQTERLGRLVTDLLDVSRLEAGAAPLHADRFAVDEFLGAAVREAEVTSRAASRDVTFESYASPVEVVADPHRLHQVVANLLDNAARHSPTGGRITASARIEAETLVVEVADEGPGIPPAERTRVFERFTRGAVADNGGTGLGLAIARWVVELHGGTIAVIDPGRSQTGCRIRFRVPVRVVRAGRPGGSAPTAGPGA